MNPTREQVMLAVFNALATMIPTPTVDAAKWTATAGAVLTPTKPVRNLARRLVHFAQSSPMPALYLGEFGNQYKWQSESLGTIVLEPAVFIYIDDGLDQGKIPSINMNNILDAFDTAFKADNANGKCTLGGLVSSIRAMGEVPIAPGDLGGTGVTVVPLQILVANGDLS